MTSLLYSQWEKLPCGRICQHDEDMETKNAGQDFPERSTVGTAMETLGYRFTAKVAAIETFRQ